MARSTAPILRTSTSRCVTRRRSALPASARRRSPCSSAVSLQNPHDKRVLGAYGRALAEAGDYNQALEVLGRAHSPDQPDWRILSAEGAVLTSSAATPTRRRHHLTALKIVPDEPSVLSNLGLSYALSKDLRNAETTL